MASGSHGSSKSPRAFPSRSLRNFAASAPPCPSKIANIDTRSPPPPEPRKASRISSSSSMLSRQPCISALATMKSAHGTGAGQARVRSGAVSRAAVRSRLTVCGHFPDYFTRARVINPAIRHGPVRTATVDWCDPNSGRHHGLRPLSEPPLFSRQRRSRVTRKAEKDLDFKFDFRDQKWVIRAQAGCVGSCGVDMVGRGDQPS